MEKQKKNNYTLSFFTCFIRKLMIINLLILIISILLLISLFFIENGKRSFNLHSIFVGVLISISITITISLLFDYRDYKIQFEKESKAMKILKKYFIDLYETLNKYNEIFLKYIDFEDDNTIIIKKDYIYALFNKEIAEYIDIYNYLSNYKNLVTKNIEKIETFHCFNNINENIIDLIETIKINRSLVLFERISRIDSKNTVYGGIKINYNLLRNSTNELRKALNIESKQQIDELDEISVLDYKRIAFIDKVKDEHYRKYKDKWYLINKTISDTLVKLYLENLKDIVSGHTK